ncbi:MAG: four helix bundle protein [Flavobacteriales bacterium]|nr:four helix bundle protein [Flavobacteriales bacterium]
MKSTFKELEVWKTSKALRVYIFTLVKSFPHDEKFRLIDQMIRSSRSIGANIAEGYGRYHYQDNIRFCIIARGSAYELMDHVEVAVECEYIDTKQQELLDAQIEQVIALINGYIKYLRSRKLKTKN